MKILSRYDSLDVVFLKGACMEGSVLRVEILEGGSLRGEG
jgi:hypothetical protein